MIKENKYQAYLKKEIRKMIPSCIILKIDDQQGLPDLLILNGDRWAMLEVKRSGRAHHQPNQDYWVKYLNRMSYASFIYPECEEEVLYELQQALCA